MTWTLHIDCNFQNTHEFCLQLNHTDKARNFRSWMGPMAKHLFMQLQQNLARCTSSQSFIIEKQLAQYALMQASFHHQRCLHQFQIIQDLEAIDLAGHNEMADMLLFIRMTPQHPCHDTLLLFSQQQTPWTQDAEAVIAQLVEAKLIQIIKCGEQTYYDKNPYPHDHVLDLNTLKLTDFTAEGPVEKYQTLVPSPII
ncbi:hypothetical protein OS175_08250 [Marinicella sp. S1101]|uniref:hypothetical protein n=1 Tax=Marinicella marina TaxID=2996016 RepID=UPI002260F957|nr:hypothetical protein [Marinicella marina]MCX7553867.1 hypothetical protein [Marinicella marina]MDJ1140359.1 hypothetical protein [Marinicella marina]